MPERYIVIWRRSSTSRSLDVALDDDGSIKVSPERDQSTGLIHDEAELVEFVNGADTDAYQVDADLAHRILGWDIP